MLENKAIEKVYDLIETIKSNWADFNDFQANEANNIQDLVIEIEGKVQKYDQGITSLQTSQLLKLKSELFFIGSNNYFERLGKKYKILPETLASLSDEFSIENQECLNSLMDLIRHILIKENPEDLNNKRAIEIASIFINDLQKIPPNWKIKLWSTGLWLSKKQITVDKSFKVRKPKDQDYCYTKSVLRTAVADHDRKMCGAIIEITISQKNQHDIDEYLKKLVRALRLFELGSVEFTTRKFEVNSLLSRFNLVGFSERNQNTKANYFKYEITDAKAANLKEFLNFTLNFLPNSNWQKEEFGKVTPIFIAIDRYNEAITAKNSFESLITNVITCLEALFLKSNERSELSHKLSQRVAKVLQCFEFPSIKVYSRLKRAYDIRSTFIHGAYLEPDKKKDFTELHKEISEYARLSLIVFIGMIEKYDKDDFLKKIDNAVLDSEANKKLIKEIKENEIVKITPYNKH